MNLLIELFVIYTILVLLGIIGIGLILAALTFYSERQRNR